MDIIIVWLAGVAIVGLLLFVVPLALWNLVRYWTGDLPEPPKNVPLRYPRRPDKHML